MVTVEAKDFFSRFSGTVYSKRCELRTRIYYPSSLNLIHILLVRSSDADVIFRSSDGVLFTIHKKYLEGNTGGFLPVCSRMAEGETAVLTEDSSILDLLFQAVYPQRMPDIGSLPFETLVTLAEAAEKYEVYRLMYICNIHIR